jgi:GntR family transcriptional regulator
MFIQIDPTRPLSIFAQIMEGIRLAIATGRLQSGERIPSMRDLAVEIRVNPNTVARAYMELERAGVIESRRGMGYFVSSSQDGALAAHERSEILNTRTGELLTLALELGFGPDEIKNTVDEIAQRISAQPSSPPS